MNGMPGSMADQAREQRIREARMGLPHIEATVMLANGGWEEVKGYLRHEVTGNGTLMVLTVSSDGEEWPCLTIAAEQWVSVRVYEPGTEGGDPA